MSDAKPKVSILLLCFNQESTVLEAASSLLMQDFDDLEIVLSDDCSTDSTFQVLQEFVRATETQHKVILTRTLYNQNVLGHFYHALRHATGDLVIAAAGDDISLPQRAKVLYSNWLKMEKPAVLCSGYHSIGPNGEMLRANSIVQAKCKRYPKIYPACNEKSVFGATAAYSMEFLKKVPAPDKRYYFEDAYFSHFAKFFGEHITYIDAPLVMYRQHDNSISNRNPKYLRYDVIYSSQIKAAGYASNKLELLGTLKEYFVSHQCCEKVESLNPSFSLVEFESLEAFTSVQAKWIEMGFLKRIRLLVSKWKDPEFCSFIMPRLVGIRMFCITKALRLWVERLCLLRSF